MNIKHLVSVLLGENDEMTPAEFVKGVPELFVRYEFEPTSALGVYAVKRWENGSYYYIGEVWHDEIDNKWMGREVAPSGRHHGHWFPSWRQAPERDTREEAAKDLWRLYSQAAQRGPEDAP